MNPSQFSPIVKKELQGLSRPAKNHLEAWIRNKLQILVGTNGIESGDSRIPPLAQTYARQRNRASDLMLLEFREIFGDLNAHLGGESDNQA
jgi:hypothetical protein